MATLYSPRIVTDGLVLALDAGNRKSYAGSGTSWLDLSGNGNTGTLTNGPTFDGGNGGSISFDGVNDYVSIPHNDILNPTTSMTLSTWINFNSLPTTSNGFAMVGKGSSTSGQGGFDFRLDFSSSELRLNLVKYFIADQRVIVSVLANMWYNMVAVQTTSSVAYYVNSVLAGTSSNSTAYQTNTSEFRIARNRDTVYTPAKIPQISMYNRALTATEVLQNYNATRSRFGV